MSKIVGLEHIQKGKLRWEKILSREYGVQYTEVSLKSLSPENKFIVPQPFYEQVYIPEEGNEVCYVEESKWNAFVGALRERYLDHPENYEEFEKLFMETGSLYVKTAEKISKENVREKSNDELKTLYFTYQKTSLRYAPFIWIQFLINNFFAEKAKEVLIQKLGESNEKLYEAYEVAFRPSQKAAILRLGELASHWNDLTNAEKDQIYEKFKWMPCLDIHNRPWAREEFFSHVHEFQRQEKEIALSYEKLLEDIAASPKERQILDITKRLAYLKDLKDDFRRQGVFYGYALFEEIARRMGRKLEDISYMLEAEIIEFLDTKKVLPQDTIRERKNGFAIFFTDEKRIVCKSGNDTEPVLQSLGITVAAELSEEIKGTPASPGNTKGRVALVRGVADLSKVKKGDILVAVVTHPDYVVAMERAVAIITDEGGLTSHAAIVSRELGIPCIVGTEVATKVLRDGDVVEVDANKGIVKILP